MGLQKKIRRLRTLVKRYKIRRTVEAIRQDFDVEYYVKEYQDLHLRPGYSPIEHFVKFGAREKRNPAPYFNTRFYTQEYPEVEASGVNPFLHYITEGRKKGYHPQAEDALFHMVYKDHREQLEDIKDQIELRKNDLSARIANGKLGEMVAKAAELDPLVMWPDHSNAKINLPPLNDAGIIIAMLELQAFAEYRSAKAAVLIPHCRMSGAARVAGALVKSLAHLYGAEHIVVVRTDLDVMEHPEWFPDDVRHINFAHAKRHVDNARHDQLLANFLRSMSPVNIFNVNSRLYWDTHQAYGQALSKSFDIYSYLFCHELDAKGNAFGYPVEYFYKSYSSLTGVITDSKYLEDLLRARFIISDEDRKLTTLQTPLASLPDYVGGKTPRNERPKIYWAGRFDPQKRIDLVFALAKRMPDIDFMLWGKPVHGQGDMEIPILNNLHLQGVYGRFDELPLEDCDAWLYTSAWDGVPTILLDIAAAGIPLVGSLVGGTPEILVKGLCEGVEDVDNISAYEHSIRQLLAHPEVARKNAKSLRDHVLKTRSGQSYTDALQDFLKQRLDND